VVNLSQKVGFQIKEFWKWKKSGKLGNPWVKSFWIWGENFGKKRIFGLT